MLVYVRGAGDIATGVAARLVRAGVSVVMADIAVPTCIRRTISFARPFAWARSRSRASALAWRRRRQRRLHYRGRRRRRGGGPRPRCSMSLNPRLWSTRFWPRQPGHHARYGAVVIAVGPGFTAPVDCDAVVETMRGHFWAA
ncbi:MAG: hypothetical protein ACLU0O_00055 [Collinsella sp.]